MDQQTKNAAKGTATGIFVGFAFMFGGYLLLRHDQTEFGWVMFVLVPFVSGFAVAAIVRKARRTVACCVCGAALCLSVLFVTDLEGYLCIIMAAPIVAVGMAIGAAVGYQVRGRIIDRMDGPEKKTLLLLLLCPFFVAAADRIERPLLSVQREESFTTECTVSTSPARTWDLVSEMDHLDGTRPFLLAVGLPVPQRCTLDRQAIGGHRVCYFNNGAIKQEVTDWRRPTFMGLKITENSLPGRHWLTFIDASWELSDTGSGTRVIRKTTIGTRLYPRWYWRPLERWGVTSEHAYVLSNLQRRQ